MKKNKPKIYLGLVHHPIVNKTGETITTSVTNMDIHDISRSCRTFGIEKYYIVTPLKAQHEVVSRILGHWEGEKSLSYNPDRSDALSLAKLIPSYEDAIEDITAREGVAPLVACTGAGQGNGSGSISDLYKTLIVDNRPCFLVFGTGWGLHASIVDQSDFKVSAIEGGAEDGFNHLSVRSAVAIYLDQWSRSADMYEASES